MLVVILLFLHWKVIRGQIKEIKNQESLNILCTKQENNVSIFRVPPLIKIICLFAAD